MNISKLGRAALYYAEKFGFAVFPCDGKVPLTERGHLNATKDSLEIMKMWQKNPYANVAVAVKVSGLTVLDLDSKPERGINAYEVLENIESEFGPLPSTPHSLTAGGGFHFFFKSNGDFQRLIGIRPGCDVLSDGYAILPPSIGKNNSQYEWDACHRLGEVPLAPLPDWIGELKRKDSRGDVNASHAKPDSFWDELVKNGIQSGQRNDSITKICGHLLRRYIDPKLAWHLIRWANKVNCLPPLDDRELVKIFESVSKREAQRRLTSGSH